MFGPDHYVPILKSKPAEFKALQLLTPITLSRMTPLIELTPPETDDENEFVDLINDISTKIKSALGGAKVFFFDLLWIDKSIRVNGQHYVEYTFDQFRLSGLKAIPVTDPGRAFDYQKAVKNVLSIDHQGLCLRIKDDNLSNVPTLDSFVSLLGSSETDTDIIIDFESILTKQSGALSASAISFLYAIPNISSWRSLTLAASSFPQSGVKPRQLTVLKRSEWGLWKNLYGQRFSLPRMVAFGDYGVDHPSLPPDFDPKTMVLGATIRYSDDSNFLIFKGGAIKKHGSQQY